MPPLTEAPIVTVFHSNSKISNAKIKKYTFASERGISVYEEIRTSSPAVAPTSSPGMNVASSSRVPPTKRQRVNLNNANPSPLPGDTIAVARPKRRKPARKIDLNVSMVFEDGITPILEPEWPSDSEASSNGSSLSPPPPSEKGSPVREASTPEDLEYGPGFASYYVIDSGDEGDKTAMKAPPPKLPKHKKPEASMQPPSQPMRAPQLPSQVHQQSRAPRSRNSLGRSTANGLPPQRYLPVQHPPLVNVTYDVQNNTNSDKVVTVAEMISKLDVLSQALVKFGGVPPPQADESKTKDNPMQDGPSSSSSRLATNVQADEPVDGLLALFAGDGDSEDGDEDEDATETPADGEKGLDQPLPSTGNPDESLIFGVRFIMNALATWAQQRIDAIYKEQWFQYNQWVRHQHEQAPTKKGRGRPKKGEAEQRPPVPPPPGVVNVLLTKTGEGEAVQAFQDVLDCGVLKVNSDFPEALTRALRTLYVQIDHLINNNTRQEQPWECLSYQAQITAHAVKVQRWKEQLARMQEEMAKQQEISHQKMMAQMNVPPHLQHRGTLTQEQTLRHRDMSLELKRGEQQAHNQPHLTPYLATPMELDRRSSNPLVGPSSVASPTDRGAAKSPNPLAQPSVHHTDPAIVQNSSSRVRDAMSRVTMYHDGRPANVNPEHIKQLSMRSGQGMKFSFDHGEKARQIFGDEAFPSAADHGSNIPRRGPMAKPVEQSPAPNGVNGRVQNPVLGSNAPPVSSSTTATRTGKDNAIGPSSGVYDVNMNGIKGTTYYNATNGTAKSNGTPASKTASPVKSPAPAHKRKLSEGVNGSTSASASPAPAVKKHGKTTIRLGKRRSADSATPAATAASASPVVLED